MTRDMNTDKSSWWLRRWCVIWKCSCKADLGPVVTEGTEGGGGCCAFSLTSAPAQFHITVMHLSQKKWDFIAVFFCEHSPRICFVFLLVMEDTGLQFLPLCNVSDRDRRVCGSFFWSGLVCQYFHQLLGGWLGSALPEWSSSALSQSESSYRPWFKGKTWIIRANRLFMQTTQADSDLLSACLYTFMFSSLIRTLQPTS